MSKEKDIVKMDGQIIEVLPNQTFRVCLDANQHEVMCYTGGKMRQNRIRLTMGDRVLIEMTPYDLTKGRITYRY